MDTRSHVLLNKNEIKEFRLQRLPGGATPPPAGWHGGVIFNTSNSRAYLNVNPADGISDAWGVSWKRFLLEGGVFTSDLNLTLNNIWIGGAGNLAVETPISSLSRSIWARPIADVPWGTSGGTLYKITDLKNPDNPQDAATKFYVDQMVQGLKTHESCLCLTVANLVCTHAAGVLTSTTNGPLVPASLDNVTPFLGSRILVKNQTVAAWNGIYVVTQLGVGGYSPWQLTRALDADSGEELLSAFVFIQQGTTWHDTGWVQTEETTALSPLWVLGTGDVRWSQFSGSGTYVAGNGMALLGNAFHFATSAGYTVGSLFYANSTTTVTQLAPVTAFRPLLDPGPGLPPAYALNWRLTDTGIVEFKNTSNFTGQLDFKNPTGNRLWTLPNYTGFLVGTNTFWDGINRMLLSGATNLLPAVWSTYAMPVDAVANRLLYSDASKNVSWGVEIPPLFSGTSLVIARKYEFIIQGTAQTFIDLTHNLNTRRVSVTLRYSDGTDTDVSREIVYTQTEVRSANTVRFTFNDAQPPSRYYAVTVVG